ncbi:MAG: SDR family NAD(P)-dependent oxidoreductase [Roseateles sp.]
MSDAMDDAMDDETSGLEIAIIGMAGRFPGAPDVDALWRLVRDGVEAVTAFSDEDLLARGVSPEALADPAYVKAGVLLDGMADFDAAFFGYSPRDAEQLDPQQRLFLECAWQALEHAGQDVDRIDGAVGVHAGTGANLYLMRHLLPRHGQAGASDIAGLIGLMNGNAADALSTRVAYKLNLRGPAVTVQTACSTSLMAVHAACQSLLSHESDMALAGGVWLNLLQEGGYRHQPGAILSSDGHCRAFDARADGTVLGSGAGVVVLKRLDEALRDGDTVHAVIKGSAVNNDGSDKVGYTAPSVAGQAAVIRAAQTLAGVAPDTIGYVEAHGTGTTLGDPIEIAALTQAFGPLAAARRGCAIGSVKSNIGHLDAAAGVAGLIKAVMALKHRTLPPSPNFERPNPRIDFEASPFRVHAQARAWPAGATPRRAGVSSFGMGGTNVHVVLEESPRTGVSTSTADRLVNGSADGSSIGPTTGPTEGLTSGTADGAPEPSSDPLALKLSARSAEALSAMAVRLGEHLASDHAPSLADTAHTLDVGRKRFAQRAVVLARSTSEAARVLRDPGANGLLRGERLSEAPSVAFLFPGQGSQHVGMARGLYEREPLLRELVDHCCAQVRLEGEDLRSLIYPEAGVDADAATARLTRTAVTQPALFVVEYAMARLWMSWGLRPDALLGHSVGEYVAACLAGVFTLEDALALVTLRGQLMQASAPGAMLAVQATPEELARWLSAGCDLAAINAADRCVLSGAPEAIAAAERALLAEGVAARRLQVSHGFHSALLDPVLADFEAQLRRIPMHAPKIPFISNLTGHWITPEEATSPNYWTRHLRSTVRFAEGLDLLLGKADRLPLEVGPGETLSSLARLHPGITALRPALSTLAHPNRPDDSRDQPARARARLWIAGVETRATQGRPVRTAGARVGESGPRLRRVPLPTYPFERATFWVPAARADERPLAAGAAAATADAPGRAGPLGMDDWFLVPTWRRTALATPVQPAGEAVPAGSAVGAGMGVDKDSTTGSTLLLGGPDSLATALVAVLKRHGDRPIRARNSAERRASSARDGDDTGSVAEHAEHAELSDTDSLAALLRRVSAKAGPIARILHLDSLGDHGGLGREDAAQRRGFHGLLALSQALEATATERGHRPLRLTVVTDRVEDVTGAEPLNAEKATLHGPCRVMPQELRGLSCRLVDIVMPSAGGESERHLAERLRDESIAGFGSPDEAVVAWRGPHRWVKDFERLDVSAATGNRPSGLRSRGVYLITGGLGGVGLALARHLARHHQARLVLVGRGAVPTSDALSRELREIEALGAELLVLRADVTDAESVRVALAQAHERFGDLHGVIHAAGAAGTGRPGARGEAEVEAVFAPKLRGTQVLLDALADRPPTFVVLCSSLASIAGGLGRIDYAGANAYLDAHAIASLRGASGPRLVSVNWDGWRGIGMAAGVAMPEGIGIAPEAGGFALERILSAPAAAQVLVSTTDLRQRLRGWEETVDAMASPASSASPASTVPTPRNCQPRPALRTPYVAPSEGLQLALAEICGELLGLTPIGLEDNLFELGGDSLLAVQILSRVRAAHGASVHPSDFFKQPTVAHLAAAVAGQLSPRAQDALVPTPREDFSPLSPVQRRLWMVDRLADAAGRAAYNQPAVLSLRGDIDPDLIEQALAGVIARHEALRTVYPERDSGEPAAVVLDAAPVPLRRLSISTTGSPDAVTSLEDLAPLVRDLTAQPFDLATGPLLRAALVRLGAAHHALVLVIHHIAFDGWSAAVLAREFSALHEALRHGRASALPALPVQYRDYARWHERRLAGEAGQRGLAFWTHYLAQAPAVSTLPEDLERPRRASHTADTITGRLEAPLARAAAALAREAGTTPYTVLLAAFLWVLHERSGQRDLIVGSDVAGREHPLLEGLIGFFVNVVPVRSRLPDDADAGATGTVRAWLARVKDSLLGAFDHQDMPFDRIVDRLALPRDRGRNPLVQVLFVLQNTPPERFEMAGVAVEIVAQPAVASKFDLAVFLRPLTDGGLGIDWVFSPALYRRATVAAFAAQWERVLRQWVDAPDRLLIAPADAVGASSTPSLSPERSSMSMPSTQDKLARLGRLAARSGAAGAGQPLDGGAAQVRRGFLAPGREFPLVLEATTPDLDAAAWARAHADEVETLVRRHGALLFRDFGLRTPQAFETFAETIEPALYGSYGDLPKKEGGRNTYQSTPYPERQMILYHNESAHLERWPRKQWFYCELPSPVGGATPIVDGREMLRRLPAALVEEFERRHLLYVRTFTPRLDVSWQDFYKTDRRDEVEQRLDRAGIAWSWLDERTLQTRTRCPAVITHPHTGDRVFFNQVQLHHPACLDPQLREDLLSTAGPGRLPRDVRYGDGAPIADETMAIIGRAYEDCAVRFEWRRGDVVMLDNMVAAHARDPYEGPRKIVVAMGAMFDRVDLAGWRDVGGAP